MSMMCSARAAATTSPAAGTPVSAGVAGAAVEGEATGAVASTSSQPAHPPMHVKVSIDADFFAASVDADVDLALPDPIPDTEVVPLARDRILIGRQSQSRGIFPQIDVRELTDDPAVSSRHATLERNVDGAWTLTDLGSTNGTFWTSAAEEPIAPGEAVAIAAGDAIYVGAWTRIELAETTS